MPDARDRPSGPPQAPDSGNGRRRSRFLIPVVLVVLGGMGYLAYWYSQVRGTLSTDDAYIDTHAITVSPQILGRIDSLFVDEGDTVSRGRLLVVLDAQDLRAQRAQAATDAEVARRSVELEQANLALAEDDYRRAEEQVRRSVIPQAQFDHAQKTLEIARARLAVARAQLGTAEARLPLIQSQLDKTRIHAASSGVVARRWVVPGDVIQPGQPVVTMFDLTDVWVTANLEETKLASIREGDPVEVTLDAYRGSYQGRVSMIGAAAASRFSLIQPDNASGNFTKVTQRIPVRIRLDAPPPADSAGPGFLPGMSATVRIRAGGGR